MYLQNIIIMLCLELKYAVDSESYSCQHREQHISKWNYELGTVEKDIHISRL